jgi:hypothetical protein
MSRTTQGESPPFLNGMSKLMGQQILDLASGGIEDGVCNVDV